MKYQAIVPFDAWSVHGRWGRPAKFRGTPKAMVIHHAVATHYQSMSGIEQSRHVESIIKGRKGFSMIAYSWCVASDGSIFEGRGTTWRNGANRAGKNGKKLGLSNRNTVSVCLYGSFDKPPEAGEDLDAQLQAVAWLARRLGITQIVGHRQVGATACPGDRLYAQLPALRAAVKAGTDGPVLNLPKPASEPAKTTTLDPPPDARRPKFVGGVTRGDIKAVQRAINTTPDGLWGPKTQEALCTELGIES